jgi:hypothetical protein
MEVVNFNLKFITEGGSSDIVLDLSHEEVTTCELF